MVLLGVPALDTLCFYISILGLKMLLMSLLTGSWRNCKKAYANPEDAKIFGYVRVDDDVERVRRAHLNDLENIPIFFITCALYLLTNPSAIVAANLIRIYTVARMIHTFVYAVCVLPQPARGIAFFVGYFITIYMMIMIFIQFASVM
ncbi:microsomal glutathione S-transferase 1-like [Arctopsyche grandis]|uniref:microsomal glutathione S-transferase 1-like n=1 Tax=Arctopsyche grandis TaxID=121162 RepID=UPI00406D6F68